MAKLRVESYTVSLTALAQARIRAWRTRLELVEVALHGWAFATRTFQRICSEAKTEKPQLTTTLPRRLPQCRCLDYGQKYVWASAAVPGLMRAGEDGGAITRFTIRKFSCSLIILVRHS